MFQVLIMPFRKVLLSKNGSPNMHERGSSIFWPQRVINEKGLCHAIFFSYSSLYRFCTNCGQPCEWNNNPKMESHLNSKHRWFRSLIFLFTTCFRLNELKLENVGPTGFSSWPFRNPIQSCPSMTIRTSLQFPCTCFMFFLGIKPVFSGFNLL